MVWLGVVVIAAVLGVLVWWGNRRAKEVEDETSYLGTDRFEPFRFRSVVPRWRKR